MDMSIEIDTMDIDIEDFRLVEKHYEPAPTKKIKKFRLYEPGEWFIAAIPGDWIAEAAKLPGHSLHVALAIMYVYGMKRGREVVLTRFHFDRFDTARGPASRGLAALQQAGLIKYTREGQRFKVTVMPVES
jgi:hypothetical protein